MRIAFHVPQLDHRGSSVTALDYSKYNQLVLNNESIIVSSRPKSTHPLEKFKDFKTILYDDIAELPAVLEREQPDLVYLHKYGNNDGHTPAVCRTGIHCVFIMTEPHGDLYAGVSEYLAHKFNRPHYVPHIVEMPPIAGDLRESLGIPKDALVIGRHGGFETFNLPFVPPVIKHILNIRKDVYFLFLNTKPFQQHERIIHLPFNPDLDGTFKRQFINSCDAMLHARVDGETFGLAVAEFSAMNKPVITFDTTEPWYDRCHLWVLKNKALVYKTPGELLSLLINLNKKFIQGRDWDCYSKPFSPASVMRVFDHVFIKGKANAQLAVREGQSVA
jgi:hypothetical protein